MTQKVAVVIVAGGRGIRAGGGMPKQYVPVAGEAVIARTLRAFAGAPQIAIIQPVIHPDDREHFNRAISGLDLRLRPAVGGGATRQASVRAGLEALAGQAPDIVLVHDAARPFVSADLIARAVEAIARNTAAIPALAVSDTVKVVDSAGAVVETLDRSRLRMVQTPQAFAFVPLLDAHRKAAAAGREDFTDDAALAEWAGMTVSTFAGDEDNMKITTPDDFIRAERLLASRLSDVRTGTGYDVHAFVGNGDHVTLGGVAIPHARALSGHSDADVALHATVDAILGVLAEGDIGVHFPPSDPQWRGVSSDRFLAFAAERVRARGGRIAHLDIVIVCEAPRIGPHRDAMRARIAEIAGISIDRVGITATTNEKLGFLGRGEGIAAFATATIRLPWSD